METIVNKVTYILYDYENGMTLIKAFHSLEDAKEYKNKILAQYPNSLLHIKEIELL